MPLLQTFCYKDKVKNKEVLCQEDKNHCFNTLIAACPDSSLAFHLKGRHEIAFFQTMTEEMSMEITSVIENALNSDFLASLQMDVETFNLKVCCKKVLKEILDVSTFEKAIRSKQHSDIWKQERQFRITDISNIKVEEGSDIQMPENKKSRLEQSGGSLASNNFSFNNHLDITVNTKNKKLNVSDIEIWSSVKPEHIPFIEGKNDSLAALLNLTSTSPVASLSASPIASSSREFSMFASTPCRSSQVASSSRKSPSTVTPTSVIASSSRQPPMVVPTHVAASSSRQLPMIIPTPVAASSLRQPPMVVPKSAFASKMRQSSIVAATPMQPRIMYRPVVYPTPSRLPAVTRQRLSFVATSAVASTTRQLSNVASMPMQPRTLHRRVTFATTSRLPAVLFPTVRLPLIVTNPERFTISSRFLYDVGTLPNAIRTKFFSTQLKYKDRLYFAAFAFLNSIDPRLIINVLMFKVPKYADRVFLLVVTVTTAAATAAFTATATAATIAAITAATTVAAATAISYYLSTKMDKCKRCKNIKYVYTNHFLEKKEKLHRIYKIP
ncbi:unnamed protein product [Psylliodes chrysocephalus]|uniref:Uncharacterized protein n=1 Tax=Psylliodes chrysocephalus TaxID=3402493 RepID=A0A9P0G6C3_9CUCU|nr:unnamed protein product [Psylliodes chrysocephala]